MPDHKVSFAKAESFSALNSILTQDELRGMLEGKDYRSVDYIFKFIEEFIYRFLGRVEQQEQTTVHTLHMEVMVGITGGKK